MVIIHLVLFLLTITFPFSVPLSTINFFFLKFSMITHTKMHTQSVISLWICFFRYCFFNLDVIDSKQLIYFFNIKRYPCKISKNPFPYLKTAVFQFMTYKVLYHYYFNFISLFTATYVEHLFTYWCLVIDPSIISLLFKLNLLSYLLWENSFYLINISRVQEELSQTMAPWHTDHLYTERICKTAHAGGKSLTWQMPCAVLCLVAQSCPALSDSINCSPPGSSVHGGSPGKKTGVGCHALLQGIFPTQGSNLGLLHCRRILYQLSYQGSPRDALPTPKSVWDFNKNS